MKAYILIERGGQYDARWKTNVLVSFDKNALEELAREHNDKQPKNDPMDRTWCGVEEVPFKSI
jgi:hypothetical protein